MLVLSRRPGETITIRNMRTDEKIVIMNGYVKSGDRCGIGVDAPAHYQVHRTELLEKPQSLPKETPTEHETSIEDYGVNHAG